MYNGAMKYPPYARLVIRWAMMLAGLLLLVAILPTRGHAQTPTPAVPEGFELLAAAPGVSLYRKDYADGAPDFVQVVRLDEGAAVRLLYGPIREARPGKGAFGGYDPRIGLKSLQQFWETLSSAYSNAFCVSNGQFFYMRESPTRLPFPLKVDGRIVSDGYARQEFAGQKLMLEIWSDRADIVELTREALYTSTAPNIVGGLSEEANKRAKHYTGRTFVGVADYDQSGAFETILIFNTRQARQVDAAEVLRSFGAAKVMMLDGGGSTQLICQGVVYVGSERLIPQALGVVAATQTPPPEEKKVPMVLDERETAKRVSLPPPMPQTSISLANALWVPLAMLPVVVFLLWFILRLQGGI